MNALPLTKVPSEGFLIEQVQEAARNTVAVWSDLCQRALDTTRREILQGDPSAQKLADHRVGLKWLLRCARANLWTASDPEYPDRQIADELEGRVLQLQHYWRMIHDRMPDTEAEQVLKRVFPE